MNDDQFDFDQFLNADDINFEELKWDLKNTQKLHLEWLQDEFKLQFDYLLDEINIKNEIRLHELAIKLTPYFIKCLKNKSFRVREWALEGLSQIYDRFPEVLEKYNYKKQ